MVIEVVDLFEHFVFIIIMYVTLYVMIFFLV